MPLYLDSFERAEWDRLMPTGLFTGITTNPLLAQRAGLSYAEISWEENFEHAARLGASDVDAAGVSSGRLAEELVLQKELLLVTV